MRLRNRFSEALLESCNRAGRYRGHFLRGADEDLALAEKVDQLFFQWVVIRAMICFILESENCAQNIAPEEFRMLSPRFLKVPVFEFDLLSRFFAFRLQEQVKAGVGCRAGEWICCIGVSMVKSASGVRR